MNQIIIRLTVVLIVELLVLLAPAAAQSQAAKVKEKDRDVFEVRLPVFVLDRRKQFVSGLTSADFIVSENGRRQTVVSLQDEKNSAPVYAALLLDASASTKGKMVFLKEAVGNFFYSLTRLRNDRAAFLTFDREVSLIQDFTDKVDLLDKAVGKVDNSVSKSALYDAVRQCSNEKMRNAPGKRVIVVVTDGEELNSRAKLGDAIDTAQRTETTVYVVSTGEYFVGNEPNEKARATRKKNAEFLLQMAAETGGALFFAGDLLALERAFAKILKEIRAAYVITYRPQNQKRNGKKRKIEVRLADEKKGNDYKVRAKTKYRALKERLR